MRRWLLDPTRLGWLDRLEGWYDQLSDLQQVGVGALVMTVLLSSSMYLLGLGSLVLAGRAGASSAHGASMPDQSYTPVASVAGEGTSGALSPVVPSLAVASPTPRPTPTPIPPPAVNLGPQPVRPRIPPATATPVVRETVEVTVPRAETPPAEPTKPRVGATTQPTLAVFPTATPPPTRGLTPPATSTRPPVSPTIQATGTPLRPTEPIRTPTPTR